MDRPRLLLGGGALTLLGGSIAIRVAFQRQMCTMAGGEPNSCTPNIAYLVPGVLAVLVGLYLVALVYRRTRSDTRPNVGT